MINDQEFDALCQNVTLRMIIYFEFVSLLRLMIEQKYIDVVVIICKLRRV